jgi:hypothetical protein
MSTQQRSGHRVGGDVGNLGRLRESGMGIAMLLATSPILFMRIKAGIRILAKSTLFAMTFCMLVFSWISNLHFSLLGGISSGDDWSLVLLAIASLFKGFWERRKRKEEIRRGEPEHTLSHGRTWFSFLPIREDLIERFVDPAVTFILGAVLHKLGLALGSWLMVTAVAFAIVERAVYLKGEDQFFNDIDTGIEAKLRAQVMTHFASQEAAPSLRRADETGASIATGADAQLAAEIEKRRKSNAEGSIQ